MTNPPTFEERCAAAAIVARAADRRLAEARDEAELRVRQLGEAEAATNRRGGVGLRAQDTYDQAYAIWAAAERAVVEAIAEQDEAHKALRRLALAPVEAQS